MKPLNLLQIFGDDEPIQEEKIEPREIADEFFPYIRFQRQQVLREKQLNYSWEANKFKLYPSMIKSLTLCPKRYINEDVHKPPSFTIEVIYKMEVGKFLHLMLQEEAQKINNFLWDDPDFSQLGDLAEGMKQKYEQIRPEVPVYHKESGISGRADAILRIKGEPVVFDIKTTSIDPEKWADGYTKKLPSKEHKLQVGIYCHLINKFKYYSKPVRKAGLGYLNLLYPAGSTEAEFESYFDFTEELDQRIGLLLEHLAKERTAYLAKEETECTYPYCRAHHLKDTLAGEKDIDL